MTYNSIIPERNWVKVKAENDIHHQHCIITQVEKKAEAVKTGQKFKFAGMIKLFLKKTTQRALCICSYHIELTVIALTLSGISLGLKAVELQLVEFSLLLLVITKNTFENLYIISKVSVEIQTFLSVWESCWNNDNEINLSEIGAPCVFFVNISVI